MYSLVWFCTINVLNIVIVLSRYWRMYIDIDWLSYQDFSKNILNNVPVSLLIDVLNTVLELY